MRIAIVGAGGVGGLLGALLARAGNAVAFLARGETLSALRTRGLKLESPLGNFETGPLQGSSDPKELGPAEAVLLGVKSWQVAALAPSLLPLLGPGAVVVPLENGVEASERLAGVLGADRVAGGLCHLFAWQTGPAQVRHEAYPPSVTVGALSPGQAPRLEALCETLRAARIEARVAPDIQAQLWKKLLFVGPLGAVGAVARVPVGELRTTPETHALLSSAMEEVRAAANGLGHAVPAEAVDQALARVGVLPATSTASMQRDLAAGRPSELDDQVGAVIRAATRGGVAVPVHRFLLAALLPGERMSRSLVG